MSTVLLAGDGFVRNDDLADALTTRAGTGWERRDLLLPWPHTPFGTVGTVTEASGTEDGIINAAAGCDALLTQMAPVTANVLEACSDLRFVGVGRGGPVNVDIDAATAAGVVVTCAPGRNATATAEYTLAMMLAACRRIPATDMAVKSGHWPSHLYAYDEVGIELSDATIGLYGAGAVGGRVAHLCAAFGARVLVHDPYTDPDELADIAEHVTLDRLWAESDVVSLHARATNENRHIINADTLTAMRRGVIIVNCARGSMVDEAALAGALTAGHVASAALDVYADEPLATDSPLREAPGTITTPHLAGASRTTARNAANTITTDLEAFWAGHPIENCVNPQVLAQTRRNS